MRQELQAPRRCREATSYRKEVVRRFGWSGGRWCRAETAVVLGTGSDQGKGSRFPTPVQKGYVHMALFKRKNKESSSHSASFSLQTRRYMSKWLWKEETTPTDVALGETTHSPSPPQQALGLQHAASVLL